MPIRPFLVCPLISSISMRPRPRIETMSLSLITCDELLAGCQLTLTLSASISLLILLRDTPKPAAATASSLKEAIVVLISLHRSSFGSICESSASATLTPALLIWVKFCNTNGKIYLVNIILQWSLRIKISPTTSRLIPKPKTDPKTSRCAKL